MLGGPVTIAQVAGSLAEQGFTSLLMFLTMLSANLAVVNFLPIPVLDGGHMVFLIYEGITGRPPSEVVRDAQLSGPGVYLDADAVRVWAGFWVHLAAVGMSLAPEIPWREPRLRRFMPTFSLRTLLELVFLFGVLFYIWFNRRPENIIRPDHVVEIDVDGTYINAPIRGLYLVDPDGNVNLKAMYGKVRVEGLTGDQAQSAVLVHLQNYLNSPQVTVSIVGWRDSMDLERVDKLEKDVESLKQELRSYHWKQQGLRDPQGIPNGVLERSSTIPVRIPSPVRCILFDAVGTLIYADPPVSAVYAKAASDFGIPLDEELVRRRFADAFVANHCQNDNSQEYRTSQMREVDRWRWIVASVFRELAPCEPLFQSLWDHFAWPSSCACTRTSPPVGSD